MFRLNVVDRKDLEDKEDKEEKVLSSRTKVFVGWAMLTEHS